MKLFNIISASGLTIACSLFLVNCKKEVQADVYKYQSDVLNLPQQVANYNNPTLPNHMAFIGDQVRSRVSNETATLGRVLFYDSKLSLNNKISCASCHKQENGFADPVKFSKGFDGGLTLRNANSISNLVNQSSFFWDSRETDLTHMVLQPVKNHIEMGMDNFEALSRKLKEVGYYDELFSQAFGDANISKERIAIALNQFLSSMVSGNAKFDGVAQGGWGGVDLSTLNDEERAGHNLFFGRAGCANCHNNFSSFIGPGAVQQEWADIGLEVTYADKGVGANQAGMDGTFKIPSLRNVALTAPYMHDGRFASLDDVLNHYSENIQASANLDWRLRGSDGQPTKMNLSSEEKTQLIAFLNTFTDQSFVSDPKFSNPFK